MQILPFQALYPNPQLTAAEPAFFDRVKEDYLYFLQKEYFQQHAPPAFFIYQIRQPGRLYTGLLACTDIEAYRRGTIQKHEHTIRTEESKQMRFTLERQSIVKPVLLTYPENDRIDEWINRYTALHPVFSVTEFPAEEQTHRLWAVDAPEHIMTLQAIFEQQVPQAYIADGHHRMAAMAMIAETTNSEHIRETYRPVFCAFFPSGQLDILEFNRVVLLPPELPLPHFIDQLQALCDIKPLSVPQKPTQKHDMTLCTPEGWYHLRWRNNCLQDTTAAALLDTALLNHWVLTPLLGIEDVRNDRRITYIEGPQGLDAVRHKVHEMPHSVGFCLYPVAFEELAELVASEGVMPPKSTWFEPRMKNGLIVKSYDTTAS
ncbi:MAG TPA: DUF1015 family protein [Saprospiraceae bacterium]|nr:DUF1015 family protein [Saprospiraceae bacterium]HMP24999.1 DUF1015 family protein [Saprospiraceae bacterium]